MSSAPIPDEDHDLPNETLAWIFGILPPAALATVSCVSHRFNAVAERLLYASISITDVLSNDNPFPTRALRCCESFSRRPHLFEVCRRLQIRWGSNSQFYTPMETMSLQSSCLEISRLLAHLPFLETLELGLGPAQPLFEEWNPVELAIQGCSFYNLQYCSLDAGSDYKASRSYTRNLMNFLETTPTLRHLHIRGRIDTFDGLSQTCMPCLAVFRGSPNAAAAILPGRPVQYLILQGTDSDMTIENLSRMAQSSLPVRTLDLSRISMRPKSLRDVASHMPAIQWIKVKLTMMHTLHYALSGIRLLAGLYPVLSEFSQLEILDLSSTGSVGVAQTNAREECSLCVQWRRACPLLRRVVFPSQTIWILSGDGITWTVSSD